MWTNIKIIKTFPGVLFVLSNKCKPDSLGGFYKLPNRIKEEAGKDT